MTQCNDVLKVLERGASIDAATAIRLLGVYRLASRILELREAGHRINSHLVTRNKKRWAVYSMGRVKALAK